MIIIIIKTPPFGTMTTEIINDSRRDDDDSRRHNIYRYKFTAEFMEMLYQFSKIHQYDERPIFKEEWNKWVEENDEKVGEEVKRLDSLGYEGDIIDKMFKSARYYFRKKSISKKEPKQRRVYVSCKKDILDAMDSHIEKGMQTPEYKPSEGFDDFCNNNKDLLKDEILHLIESKITDAKEIMSKVKKTYKNRYFIVSNREVN
jgi:hypothetical protein